jgi:ribosomal protein L40E
MSSKKCSQCGMVNWAQAAECKRCGVSFNGATEATGEVAGERSLLKRVAFVAGLVALFIFGSYVSLRATSEAADYEQRQIVGRAIEVLERSDFGGRAFVLRRLVNYRTSDSWWNRWVGHQNAYAATNFPFEVVTLYPDFFSVPVDDVERAVILLHESYHLAGRTKKRLSRKCGARNANSVGRASVTGRRGCGATCANSPCNTRRNFFAAVRKGRRTVTSDATGRRPGFSRRDSGAAILFDKSQGCCASMRKHLASESRQGFFMRRFVKPTVLLLTVPLGDRA